MPASILPARPSLHHLKSEAKQLHKELTAGDPSAAERARSHLRRLADDDSVEDVTLQEAQHVLGREYGFRDWQGLAAAAEIDFDGLSALSDEDTHQLLRQVDQKDLVVALKLAGEDVKRRMLTGMSDRVRQFIAEEMMFLGPLPEEEVFEVQGRILQQVRLLAREEAIGWPPGSATPPPKPDTDLKSGLDAAVRRKLSELSEDEIRAMVHELSARVQALGVISLDAAAKICADGFVREGLRLAADGCEPALLEDMLLTRTRALCQAYDNFLRMTIEGCASLSDGDKPGIVTHKLHAVYSTDFDKEFVSRNGAVDKLRQRLRSAPVGAMDLELFTETFGDLATIVRWRGPQVLTEILDEFDDEFVRVGLRLVVAGGDTTALVEELESRMPAALKVVDNRCRLFTAGITAIQEARKGADLDAAMDTAVSD